MTNRTSRITMQQLANELKLSRLTVSSIVNDKAQQRGIPQRTVQRVQDYLKRQGYVPSRQAVALRTGRRSAVGILHCGHLFSHLTEAFNLMVDEFSSQPEGLEIMVVPRERLVEGLRELVARGIKSLVWIQQEPPRLESSDETVLRGLLAHIPTVIYNYHFNHDGMEPRLAALGVHMVGVNRERAYGQLARFLHSLGHRTIALPDVSAASRDHPHQHSLIAAFETASLIAIPCRPANGNSTNPVAFGRELAQGLRLTMQTYPITAACFSDDEVAGFAMVELRRRGLRIPEDLTVTGFDGIRLAATFPVPLTTLRMPVPEMVRQIAAIFRKQPATFEHRFEMELVQRESHGPASRAGRQTSSL